MEEIKLVKLDRLSDEDSIAVKKAMRRSREATAKKAVLYILRDYWNLDATLFGLRTDFEVVCEERDKAEEELEELKKALKVINQYQTETL